MIYVIGEASFHLVLLLLLAYDGLMLAVALSHGLLHSGVESDNVAGNFAKLIVRQRSGIVDPFFAFGLLGKPVEPAYVFADSSCGQV